MRRLSNKIRVSWKNQKQYNIFKSRQLIGILVLLISLYFFVVSLVQVSGFTSVYSYTLGFLFGYYSYFILAGLTYWGFSIAFNLDLYIERYLVRKYNRSFNFSWLVYLFFVCGLALIVESAQMIQANNNIFLGSKSFEASITTWWNDFTKFENPNPSLPAVNNSGVVVAILSALISSWTSYVFSIICGLIFIGYFFFYIYYGSIWTIIKNSQANKHQLKGAEILEHETKILDLDFENDHVLEQQTDDNMVDEQKTVTIAIDDVESFFDIENPFENDTDEATTFIATKIQEYNQEHNLLTKFDVRNNLSIDKRLLDPTTFEFELDIFDTLTSPLRNDRINLDVAIKPEPIEQPLVKEEEPLSHENN